MSENKQLVEVVKEFLQGTWGKVLSGSGVVATLGFVFYLGMHTQEPLINALRAQLDFDRKSNSGMLTADTYSQSVDYAQMSPDGNWSIRAGELRAIKATNSPFALKVLRGIEYLKNNDNEKAFIVFDSVCKERRQFALGHYYCGVSELERSRSKAKARFETADSLFELYIRIKPMQPDLYFYRALTLTYLDRGSEATEHLKQASQLDRTWQLLPCERTIITYDSSSLLKSDLANWKRFLAQLESLECKQVSVGFNMRNVYVEDTLGPFVW